MKELKTEVIIKAPAEIVWKVLTTVSDYKEWNPFIRSIEGDLIEGQRLKVVLQPPDSGTMTFKPVCLSYQENKEFIWKGQLMLPGVFDGKHIFELTPVGENETRFVQREEFTGFLVPILWKRLNENTKRGFELMNQKLKERAEK